MKHVLIHARTAGRLRRVTFESREHFVVPVVAVVEGVLQASNAPHPEFVPLASLQQSVAGWNGRALTLNHPEFAGEKVSANDPTTLEHWSIGRVFNARIEGNALVLDAFLDPARAEAVAGAAEVLARLRSGNTVEVSVGAFVETSQQAGKYRGATYYSVWASVLPDHLALLSEGLVGACSVAAGCGALRANSNTKGCAVMCECTSRQDSDVPPLTDAEQNDGVPAVRSMSEQLFGPKPKPDDAPPPPGSSGSGQGHKGGFKRSPAYPQPKPSAAPRSLAEARALLRSNERATNEHGVPMPLTGAEIFGRQGGAR
jgi:hypothetical protein